MASYMGVKLRLDRIRIQISAGHSKEDIDFAVKAFGEVKKEMGL